MDALAVWAALLQCCTPVFNRPSFAIFTDVVAGWVPGLLVFDSKLTTHPVLDELAARGITFLTLRQRGSKVLQALTALPASAWSPHNLRRARRYHHPQIHEQVLRLKGIEYPSARSRCATSATTSPHC